MSAAGYRSLWLVLMDFKVLLFAFILLFSEIQQGLPLMTGTPKLQSTIHSILRNAAFLHNPSSRAAVLSKHCSPVSVMTPFYQYFMKCSSLVLIVSVYQFQEHTNTHTHTLQKQTGLLISRHSTLCSVVLSQSNWWMSHFISFKDMETMNTQSNWWMSHFISFKDMKTINTQSKL